MATVLSVHHVTQNFCTRQPLAHEFNVAAMLSPLQCQKTSVDDVTKHTVFSQARRGAGRG